MSDYKGNNKITELRTICSCRLTIAQRCHLWCRNCLRIIPIISGDRVSFLCSVLKIFFFSYCYFLLPIVSCGDLIYGMWIPLWYLQTFLVDHCLSFCHFSVGHCMGSLYGLSFFDIRLLVLQTFYWKLWYLYNLMDWLSQNFHQI